MDVNLVRGRPPVRQQVLRAGREAWGRVLVNKQTPLRGEWITTYHALTSQQ